MRARSRLATCVLLGLPVIGSAGAAPERIDHVPLRTGLTVVSVLHFPEGDRENVVTVDSMTADAVTYTWHASAQTTEGERDDATFSRSVRITDLESATRLHTVFVPDDQADYPGYTAFSLSTAVYCELLTRVEAESVLGSLVVEPFRSAEGSPLADEQGSSCTFYTRGHHALVLTPTAWDGKGYFDLSAGTTSIMRSKLGGADAGDALDGPWDQASQGVNGSLLFLKDDQVVELSYQLSSTDIAGAAKLAALALTHLQSWK